MKVYLVVDINNSPGRVLAIFADEENAEMFVDAARLWDVAEIVERTLFYGQPPNPGYNE
jgi:hypothetical protein